MAKRFIDTELFKQGWFRKLPPTLKSAWIYLITNCDHAGVYEPDLELMSFCVGSKITKDDIIKHLGDQISSINGRDKWFLHKFVKFQYGELNPNAPAHRGVLKVLEKYNLDVTVCKGLGNPSVTVQDKVKVKVQDKSMASITDEYLKELQMKHKDVAVAGEFDKFKDYCASKGKTYKDYRAGFRNWLRSEFTPKSTMVAEETIRNTETARRNKERRYNEENAASAEDIADILNKNPLIKKARRMQVEEN